MEKCPKVCFDRILPRDLMRFQPTRKMRDGARRAIAPIGKTWMNGSTLRVRFMGGTPTEQTVAREQVNFQQRYVNSHRIFRNRWINRNFQAVGRSRFEGLFSW